jgi:hypothetical protein
VTFDMNLNMAACSRQKRNVAQRLAPQTGDHWQNISALGLDEIGVRIIFCQGLVELVTLIMDVE